MYVKRSLGLLCPLLALLATQAPQVHATVEEWQFQVFAGERDLGLHAFTVESSASERTVVSDAKFNVKVLFVDVFNYEHTSTERWRDNCLVKIESKTRANRERFAVSGSQNGEAFRLQDRPDPMSGCIQTFAYWNPEILQSTQLLNSQTGELESVEIRFAGEESVRLRDRTINANRYRIHLEDNYIDVLYDQASYTWVGLETLSPGGDEIRYLAVKTPLQS